MLTDIGGCLPIFFFFFFNDTATTEIYTLSLHDALPICYLEGGLLKEARAEATTLAGLFPEDPETADRKSTRLNSSHLVISYAVFCLKKKKRKHGRSLLLEACSRLESYSCTYPRDPTHSL